MHGHNRPRPVIAAAAAGTPVAFEVSRQQRQRYYQQNQALEDRRLMSERALDAHGRTLAEKLEIILAKQAAAALAQRNGASICTAATSHSLPGSDIGLNSGPSIGQEPISTAEGSIGGHSFENVTAGSAVMVSPASDEVKAQWIAPSVEHANGAMSRQDLMPQVVHAPLMVPPLAHALQKSLLAAARSSVACCLLAHLEVVGEGFASGSAALTWLQTQELAVIMNQCIWLLAAQRAHVCYEIIPSKHWSSMDCVLVQHRLAWKQPIVLEHT